MNPNAASDPRGLQRIEDETHRLIRFVSELLDVSRAEEGRILGKRERVDVAELVRAMATHPRSDLHPVVAEVEQSVMCLCDGNRIEQVLENLLENAAKYSPEGGSIWIKVWSVGTEAHFTVRDQGIGIPADELPRIFERFHRGSNVNDRQFPGLGLGLFICRSIVEAHGGHLTAESALGRGTTIHVVLPRHLEEESPVLDATGGFC